MIKLQIKYNNYTTLFLENKVTPYLKFSLDEKTSVEEIWLAMFKERGKNECAPHF